jgi:hypothetical protein
MTDEHASLRGVAAMATTESSRSCRFATAERSAARRHQTQTRLIAHLPLAQGGGWVRLPKRDIASPKARSWSPSTSPNGLWEPLPVTDAAIASR